MQGVKWETYYSFMVFSIAGRIISACYCVTEAEAIDRGNGVSQEGRGSGGIEE